VAITADVYRKANRKIVEVDGYKWEIRKIPPLIVGKLMEFSGIEMTGKPLTDAELKEIGKKMSPRIFDILKTVLPVCVAQPKISLNPNSEDELDINELSLTTAFGLLDEIYKFSGLTKEAAEFRKKFRT